MQIIALSDYRVQDIDLLIEFLEKLPNPPDLILYAGDDIERFSPYSNEFLSRILLENKKTMLNKFKKQTKHVIIRNDFLLDKKIKYDSRIALFASTENNFKNIVKFKNKILKESGLSRLVRSDDPKLIILTSKENKIIVGIVHFPVETNNYFEKIAHFAKYGLCAIIGNDDGVFVRNCIWGNNVHSVQDNPFNFGEFSVIGIEGAVDDPLDDSIGIGYTLYNENELHKYLNSLKKKIRNKKIIILSHSPPKGYLDLALRFGMRNIGSKSLNSFIKSHSKDIPLIVCGHVHIQGGQNTKFNHTHVVNAASHDSIGEPGRVANIEIQNDKVTSIIWHELYGLSGVIGIGPATSTKFKMAGINSIEKIVSKSPEQISKEIGCSLKTAHNYHIHARSVFEKKIIVIQKMTSTVDDALFLDIETDLTQSLVWLIGLYFKKSDKFIQIVAKNPSDEKEILQKFMSIMKTFSGKIYTFSGTRFDERVLKNRLSIHKIDHSDLPEFIDIYKDIRSSIAFPLKSYGLKSISDYFGYYFRHKDLNGLTVAMEYLVNYQKTKNQKLLQKLLEYNEDDVRSMDWLVNKIVLFTQESSYDMVTYNKNV
jgi:uncharacterized protein YprB with RNaseH-like and TPR domain/Icc-related predicted phosphoesterase